MSSIKYAFLTASLTIIGGIIVFIIEKYIAKVFEKKNKYIEIQTEIAINLKFYANLIHNPLNLEKEHTDYQIERYDKAKDNLRYSAMKLISFSKQQKNYLIRIFIGLPESKKVNKAKENIVGLSNSLVKDKLDKKIIQNNKKREEIIKENLDIND